MLPALRLHGARRGQNSKKKSILPNKCALRVFKKRVPRMPERASEFYGQNAFFGYDESRIYWYLAIAVITFIS